MISTFPFIMGQFVKIACRILPLGLSFQRYFGVDILLSKSKFVSRRRPQNRRSDVVHEKHA
uniref:Uncharacterized protein n=1 Tax=Romanomermis culicivorax TaxID=13658 RepID=A0A915LBW1_ROMCU